MLCSVATNNVQNPFTPFGDASLLRMANFYANVAHAAVSEFDACLDLVTDLPARLMNLRDYWHRGRQPRRPHHPRYRQRAERDCRTAGCAGRLQERPPGVLSAQRPYPVSAELAASHAIRRAPAYGRPAN